MKIFTNNGYYFSAFHKQPENLGSLIEELKKFDRQDAESVKLTAAINGQTKRLGGAYISPLFSDFDRDDLMAIHFYAGLFSARLIVEDNVLPELPFLVSIIDQDGYDLVTLKCDRDGWTVLKFAAGACHIHSLIELLERVDTLAAALVTKPSFVAA